MLQNIVFYNHRYRMRLFKHYVVISTEFIEIKMIIITTII